MLVRTRVRNGFFFDDACRFFRPGLPRCDALSDLAVQDPAHDPRLALVRELRERRLGNCGTWVQFKGYGPSGRNCLVRRSRAAPGWGPKLSAGCSGIGTI